MWFVIVTMSTVGYGDISPTTGFGYLCGLLTIIIGVTIFSLVLMVTGQYYSDLLDDVLFFFFLKISENNQDYKKSKNLLIKLLIFCIQNLYEVCSRFFHKIFDSTNEKRFDC